MIITTLYSILINDVILYYLAPYTYNLVQLLTILISYCATTVTPKSIAMSNLDVVDAVHHKHLWELCHALVGPNIAVALGDWSLGHVIWPRGSWDMPILR